MKNFIEQNKKGKRTKEKKIHLFNIYALPYCCVDFEACYYLYPLLYLVSQCMVCIDFSYSLENILRTGDPVEMFNITLGLSTH